MRPNVFLENYFVQTTVISPFRDKIRNAALIGLWEIKYKINEHLVLKLIVIIVIDKMIVILNSVKVKLTRVRLTR